jgi:hypothetical protein
VIPDQQVRKGHRASKELLDHKVFRVQLVCRVHKVRVVIRDPLGLQVLRDRRGSPVQLVPKVRRVLRDQLDQWDRPGLGWSLHILITLPSARRPWF